MWVCKIGVQTSIQELRDYQSWMVQKGGKQERMVKSTPRKEREEEKKGEKGVFRVFFLAKQCHFLGLVRLPSNLGFDYVTGLTSGGMSDPSEVMVYE